MVMRATKLAVLIDLQNAIVGMSTAPHPAAQVVANSAKLAEAFRGHGAPVVYVRVDLNDFLELPVDQPINLGPALFRRLPLLPDFSPATSCVRNVTAAAGAASAAVVDPTRRTTHSNLILAICCMSLGGSRTCRAGTSAGGG